MSEDVGREPCFWSMTPSSNPGYNLQDRERWITAADGSKRKEKFPQRGHQGDYEDRRPARGVRSITMVRHDGHQDEVVLTNAAAHLDHTTPYGQYVLMKARHLGWFSPGSCPAALIAAGELSPYSFIAPGIADATPCARGTYSLEKPCQHAIAETAARVVKNTAENAARVAANKSVAEQSAESQKMMAETVAQALAEQQKSNALQIEALMALLKQNGISADGPKDKRK